MRLYAIVFIDEDCDTELTARLIITSLKRAGVIANDEYPIHSTVGRLLLIYRPHVRVGKDKAAQPV